MATFTGTVGADTADAIAGTLTGFTGGTLAELQDAIGDTINASNGADSVVGGTGNDIISGGADNDLLDGGAGDDTLQGDAGADTVMGGTGNDILISGPSTGPDTLDGGADIDLADLHRSSVSASLIFDISNPSVAQTLADGTVLVNIERITIFSGFGHDSITGGGFTDSINGGIGNDTINAGGGDDFVQRTFTSSGVDSLNGGDGFDTLRIYGNGTAVTLNFTGFTGTGVLADGSSLANFELLELVGWALNDNITGSDLRDLIVDQSGGNDTLNGGAGNDYIEGGTGNDSLSGGAGHDSIVGGSDNDVLDGGTGNDTLDGGLGNDTLLGGADDDTIISTAGVDSIDGGASTDVVTLNRSSAVVALTFNLTDIGSTTTLAGDGTTVINVESFAITGGSGSDSFITLGGSDTLTGGAGNDTLDGGTGNDTLLGGADDDTIISTAGVDSIDGGTGNDILTLDRSTATANLTLNLTSIASITTLTGDGTTVTGVETFAITGGSGNDTLTTLGGNDTLSGGDGNDTLTGGAGNDSLEGGAGQDSLNGGDGNDTIALGDNSSGSYQYGTGGTGNDTMTAGLGYSQLNGDDGDDVLSFAGIGSNAGKQFWAFGGNNNDSLTGGDGNDNLNGDAGNDTLIGGASNDTLFGGTGADSISGGDGNDTLDVGTGADSVSGGAGNDTLTSSDSLGADVIDGGLDFDTMTLNRSGSAAANNADFSNSAVLQTLGDGTTVVNVERITFTSGSGDDTITSANDAAGYSFNVVSGGAGNDSLTAAANGAILNGDAGNDTLTGSAGLDYLSGGADNDTISLGDNASGSYQYGYGGTGNDTMTAGLGYSQLSGEDGDDVLSFAGIGSNAGKQFYAYGGANNDSLTGGDGNDNLNGDAGNDTLDGGAGNDTLDGGTGADSISGGAGNDTFTSSDSLGADIIDGGLDFDSLTLNRSGSAAANNADFSNSAVLQTLGDGTTVVNVERITFTSGTGNDTITSANDAAGYSFNVVSGGAGNDSLTAAANGATLNGDAGNDTLTGSAGLDYFSGGADNDTISLGDNASGSYQYGYGGTGNDTMTAGLGYSQLSGEDGDDVLSFAGIGNNAGKQFYAYGGNNNDSLTGGDGNDYLSGDAGSDTLDGGAGNDTLDGGTGADSISGGAGNDTFTSSDSLGADVIDGGLDFDTMTLNRSGSAAANNADFSNSAVLQTLGDGTTVVNVERITFTSGSGDDTITSANDAAGYSFNVVSGGAGNDSLTAAANGAILNGDAGNDTLTGSAGLDQLNGGADNDTIALGDNSSGSYQYGYGGTGNDTMTAGLGYSQLSGEDGDDVLSFAGIGNNAGKQFYAYGGNHNDSLTGGDGNDYLQGDAGNDTIDGGASNDTILGGAGNDVLSSGTGADIIDGGTETDSLTLDRSGATANLTFVMTSTGSTTTLVGDGTTVINIETIYLTGGSGNDKFTTLAGNDVLHGLAGADTLDGGAGFDSLFDDTNVNSDVDVLSGGADADSIFSFGGADVIDGGSGTVDHVVLDRTTVSSALTFIVTDTSLVTTLIGDGATVVNVEFFYISSGSGADKFTTAGNNDYLKGNGGNDTLDGGGGTDIAAFDGARSTYTIERFDGAGTTWVITDTDAISEGDDGSDTLSNIETLSFGVGSPSSLSVASLIGALSDGDAGTNTVAESAAIGATVGVAASATDGNSEAVTYTLTDSAGGRFAVDLNTGVVTVASALNYETATSHAITVRATSADGSYTDKAFTIAVTNVAPSVPTDTDGASGGSVAENASNGASVGITASSTDPNGGTVTYSLFDHAGGRFQIGSSSGVVTVANASLLDYESATSHTITVRASDASSAFNDQTFMISVSDVNEAPAAVTVTGTISSLDEDQSTAARIKVADIAVTDDALGSEVLGLTGADAANFEIDGFELFLKAGTWLDFEQKASYSVAVTADDPTVGGNPDATSTSYLLTVNDINPENVTGTPGDDLIVTGAFGDTLSGLGGYDTLDGGAGNDTMTGGAGNDVFKIGGGDDVITDFGSRYFTASLSGANENPANASTATGAATLVLNKAQTQLSASVATTGLDFGGQTVTTDDNVTGFHIHKAAVGVNGAIVWNIGADTSTVTNAPGGTFTSLWSSSEGLTAQLGALGSDGLYMNIHTAKFTGGEVRGQIDEIAGNADQIDLTAFNIGNFETWQAITADVAGSARTTRVYNGAASTLTINSVSRAALTAAAFIFAASLDETLTGTANADDLFGAGGNDTLDGGAGNDRLYGENGDDRLDGGAGNDQMFAGAGNDTYVVDALGDKVTELAGAGTDTAESFITLTLGANLENLLLQGSGNINGTGNTLANTISGNAGNNVLAGGTGIDTLSYKDATGAITISLALTAAQLTGGAGNDTVSAFENLVGSALFADKLTGSSAANLILGLGGNDTLDGGSGNDTLDGGTGADSMTGGLGNDLFRIDDAGDTVVEAFNQGTDTVEIQASGPISVAIGTNVENLTYLGSADGTSFSGNDLANVIIGGSGSDSITGGLGNDRLQASNGAGDGKADTLQGGGGNDTFVVYELLDDAQENSAEGVDTVESYAMSYTLGADIENLTIKGGIAGTARSATGNGLANILLGDISDDTLDGGVDVDAKFIDQLKGGKGNDTYVVRDGKDAITELASQGTDTIKTDITLAALAANVENLVLTGSGDIAAIGSTLANVLTSNSGNNVLNGMGGIDTASFTTALGAVIASLATGTATGDGSDTLTGIENLTGSAHDDTLTGNASANVLDGGAGNDAMAGGGGNDTYVVDNGGDSVIEAAAGGTDTVQSSLAAYTLTTNVENLVLTGTGHIAGTGNTGANTITGNAGNNTLDGGSDSSASIVDQLKGGKGDDTYIVLNLNDKVTELANEGKDTVKSSVTYTLGLNVENLELQGPAALSGTGNTLNNDLAGNLGANLITGLSGNDTLSGGGGADTLNGGMGNDTLVGGADGDIFLFNTALTTTGLDTIGDFGVGPDKIRLENAIFTALGAGPGLAAGAFALATDAPSADDRIIYNTATGALIYDANGGGSANGGQTQFAVLTNLPTLQASDFEII